MTISKRKKIIRRVLNSLNKAELSKDKGTILREKYPKPNSKKRRHSGRKRICFNDKDYPVEFDYWDDWIDYRDSFRDYETFQRKKKRKYKK